MTQMEETLSLLPNNHDKNANNATMDIDTTKAKTKIKTPSKENLASLMNANGDKSYYDSTAINTDQDDSNTNIPTKPTKLRDIAISLSLYANITITLIKLYTYIQTFSLSVLATLVDSILDICSQGILAYAEYQYMRASTHDDEDENESNRIHQRSSELFPSGASRVEPISVLICSALMGMASFEVIKESITELLYHQQNKNDDSVDNDLDGQDMSNFYQMVFVVVLKLFLMQLCSISIANTAKTTKTKDGMMEALKLDHLNDCLSNAIAALALLAALSHASLWFLDPVGAIVISIYIIWSWYNTGREQITHLSGIAAPSQFVQEICTKVEQYNQNNSTTLFDIDWCRAYHFGPKYLVEMEIVLPPETILKESHDLGMKLQYFIESMDDVERCFVHIDYESRPYDEHVVSKIYDPDVVERKFLLRHSATV